MKIFITGASGFVGEATTRTLSKKHTILAMSRSEKTDLVISNAGGKPVRCELNSVNSSSLQGIDVVIHSAAYVEQWGFPRFLENKCGGDCSAFRGVSQSGC
ncbi:NADH(P)-binding protein, PF13460 domain protein [Leptospira interrogans serovar Valbuzzi str. Duyster]|nr:NADH(P)-binding protein, PF13460 domain protein [Leptospira interrogans serovar Valbuzzi str. Duyster]ENO72768.1 NADH(P)-binding protein, PF13460 domain protein [Leptospira interrogans serovar Valbuzzi str. Valbuzzi]